MRNIVITGSAGFIGCNAAAHYADRGWRVTALDNFSREGTEENAEWLARDHGVEVQHCDVRDAEHVADVIHKVDPDAVVHLAAQTAVTTSMEDPRSDFATNVAGTLNVLEAIRAHAPNAHLIYSSTNKVYGELSDVAMVEEETRHRFRDLSDGVPESRPLNFRTPYGVSKGAADQYVLDWSRTFDLTTTSLRQSCIYGPRQVGVEAQGWVAWFVRAALADHPITIYGDGKQVRDILYIDDLLVLFDRVLECPEASKGRAFNVGGGRKFTVSLLELLDLLEEQLNCDIPVRFDDWRPGDQRVFFCDINSVRKRLGWEPKVRPSKGLERLIRWVRTTSSTSPTMSRSSV